MATWVGLWDDSYNPVDLDRLPEMYAAGFRVWARYVAAGRTGKHWTATQREAWFACGPDTGMMVLLEATGDEPVTHPELGDDHARAARAAARELGVPDSVSIAAAMDTNVNTAQWRGPIADYCAAWTAADTVPPVMYIEADAGAYLHDAGLTAGTFTPAAYAWNVPPVLYTPDNAPAHAVATQEYNGRDMGGGNVDIGHIRTDAPCVWWRPADPTGDQMTPAEFLALLRDPQVAAEMRKLAGAGVYGYDPGVVDPDGTVHLNGGIPVPDYRPDSIASGGSNPTAGLGWAFGELLTNVHATMTAPPAPAGGHDPLDDADLAGVTAAAKTALREGAGA